MDSRNQIEEAAAQWLSRQTSGDWSEADAATLNQWLDISTANRVAFLRVTAAWQQAHRLKALGVGTPRGTVPPAGQWRSSPYFDVTQTVAPSPAVAAVVPQESSLPKLDKDGSVLVATNAESDRKNLSNSLGNAPPQHSMGATRWRVRRSAIAATIVLATALGVVWHVGTAGPSYRTPVGGLASVPISDGSKVTLNTNSKIRVALTEGERRIDLGQGEAFFEVAKDSTRPFVVSAGDKRIIAVGTKFSVRRDGDNVQVVVTEGRVRVERTSAESAPVTQLTAGNVARATNTGVLVQERSLAEAESYLSWRSGYLMFRDTRLLDAVAEFNRYNMRRVTFGDAEVAELRVGGNFRSTNVDAFVRLLQEAYPVHVEQLQDSIMLSSTGKAN